MIFIMTAENLAEVYYDAQTIDWWIPFYHVFCALLGLFMFVPIFISRFEEGFTKYNVARKIRNTALKRVGIVRVFILLDANSDHSLDRVQFSRFMKFQKHIQSQNVDYDEQVESI